MKQPASRHTDSEKHGLGLTRRQWLIGSATLLCSLPWVRAVGQPGSGSGARLRLSCAQSRVLAPFACAQTFAPGEIPAGTTVGCELAQFQAIIKNRWPDGSAKIALLAGRADLSANVERLLTLTATAPTAGAAPTETDLIASGVQARIDFAPLGQVELGDLIGVASVYDAALRRWGAGRIRTWYAGPESASWLYSAPIGSDPHLVAWFEVRLWLGGQVEILAWIENGFLKVADPIGKSGTARLIVGGATRFESALTLPHHARAVMAEESITHWLDNQAPVRIRADVEHLQATGLVPAYRGRTPANSALLTELGAVQYAPLAQCGFPAAMGSAGYHPSIGLLPMWDAAALSSNADLRALNAVFANACAAGRFSLHYRDETTHQPLRFSQHPTLVINSNNAGIGSAGSSGANTYTPSNLSPALANWATSHHPSVGYLAYLLSGRYYFLEQAQFSAAIGYLKNSDVTREQSGGVLLTNAGANTTRGAAWSLRTLAQAACATPDEEPLRTEFMASLDANVRYYHQRGVAVPQHPEGVCPPYGDYTSGDNVYQHAAWMEDFLTAAFGYLLAMRLPLPGNGVQLLVELFHWKARSIVGRLGPQGVVSAYNYRDAAQYNLAVAPFDAPSWSGPWYANWGEAYEDTLGTPNAPDVGTALRGGHFPEPTSYWGNLQPAIAYAVTHGVSGAAQAHARMTSASNWPEFLANEHEAPLWSVRPMLLATGDSLFADGFEPAFA